MALQQIMPATPKEKPIVGEVDKRRLGWMTGSTELGQAELEKLSRSLQVPRTLSNQSAVHHARRL